MRHRDWRAAIGVAFAVSLALVVSGCLGLGLGPDRDDETIAPPTLRFDRYGQRCVEVNPALDDAPLGIGAWWRYRDATADHLPTWRPGEGREDRVLASVSSGERECYVVHSDRPDGTTLVRYIYRGEAGWVLLAEDHGEGPLWVPGSPTILRLPLSGGGTPFRWEYELGDKLVDVQIIFTELVRVPAGVFPECRKLKLWMMEAGGCRCHSSAEAEYYWFSRGIGAVKWVTGSRNYELTATSYLEARPPIVLEWANNGASLAAAPGQTVIVQLPTAWDSPYRWSARSANRDALIVAGESRHPDLAPLPDGILYGSYIAQLRVPEAAASGARASLTIEYRLAEDPSVHAFRIEVTVR
jgi:hypothetical protein